MCACVHERLPPRASAPLSSPWPAAVLLHACTPRLLPLIKKRVIMSPAGEDEPEDAVSDVDEVPKSKKKKAKKSSRESRSSKRQRPIREVGLPNISY